MNGKKGRAMSDADDAGGGEFLIEQFVQCVFARLVEGRGCLVEENPIGTDEQDARKGQPLLFTER